MHPRNLYTQVVHLINEGADEFGFKNVAKRDPVEKPHQCVQGSSY